MRKLTPEQWKRINKKRYGQNTKPTPEQLKASFERQKPPDNIRSDVSDPWWLWEDRHE